MCKHRKTKNPYQGIFWGRFDPPTKAHQEIIKIAVQDLQLEKIHIVINDFNRNCYFSAKKRAELFKKLLQNELKGINAEVLIQNTNNLHSYEIIKKKVKKPCVAICGSDSFDLWLKKGNCTTNYDCIAVFQRKEFIPLPLSKNICNFKLPDGLDSISATNVRAILNSGLEPKALVPDSISHLLLT
jgi:nicotinic acid mononucleotide adenylyltransferase